MSEFKDGWIIGNFEPSLFQTEAFEVAIKHFLAGDVEVRHFQQTASELTTVIQGRVRLSDHVLGPGEMLLIEPHEEADFEALEDSIVVAVKWPSLPGDKVVSAE